MRNKFSLNKLMSIGLVCFVTFSGCGESIEKSAIGDSGATASSELEIIATGANIAGANGLAIGPDGNLYVTSVLGSTISVINPESGEIVKTYGSDDGVIGPDDVDFFSDGSWFWTSIMTGQVAGFEMIGSFLVRTGDIRLHGISYGLISTTEEALEMTGLIIFIHVLLRYILDYQSQKLKVNLRLSSDQRLAKRNTYS